LLLSDLELDYVVENEVMLITTRQQADSRLETHVYETRLLKTISSKELAGVIVETIAPESWSGASGRGAVKSLPGFLIIYQTQKVHAEVIDLLQQLQAHEGSPIFKSLSVHRE
jgi:hypothetical protein